MPFLINFFIGIFLQNLKEVKEGTLGWSEAGKTEREERRNFGLRFEWLLGIREADRWERRCKKPAA